jgi:CO/xanthine dehydrogenase FAD-binding subunit
VTRFRYVQPGTLDTAIDMLRESGPDARLLAGGTDVLVRLRSGHMRPAVVIDIKRIDALDNGIARVGNSLRIGARCSVTTLLAHDEVRATFPALIEAARVVGSVQIRNRATLVGNICNASPAADTAPALLAYGATVNIAGGSGTRQTPLAEFFRGPGRTVLGRDELVTSVDLPLPDAMVGAAFTRLTRRRGVDLATLTVACAVSKDGAVRIGLGAVAPTPLLVTGSIGSANAADESFIARVAAQASPISDVRAGRDYRVAMLTVYIGRTLQLAMTRLNQDVTWNRPDSQSTSQ